MPIVVFILVAVNIAQRTFWHPEIPAILIRDLQRSLGLIDTAEAAVDTSFPIARDLVSPFIAVLIALNLSVLYRQWAIFETLFPDLKGSGVLTIRESGKADVEKAIKRMNERFHWFGSGTGLFMILFIAFIASVYLVLEQQNGGVFYGLTPVGIDVDGRSAWAAEAYGRWWATYSTQPVGFVVYVGIVGLALYYMLLQNLVGMRFVGFVIRHTWRGRLSFGINPTNPDGRYGWAPLGRLLVTAYVSTGIHFLSLLMSTVLFINGLNQGVAIPLIVLMLAGPLYLLAPVVILVPAIRRFKRTEIEEVRKLMTPLLEQAESDDERLRLRQLMRSEVHDLGKMSAFPFSLRAVIGVILYVVPAIALVLATIGLSAGD